MTKVMALLLAVWYCVSIIGFDVHTCKDSGRTFVTTFAEGMTCADIHPEHRCGHACHHESSCCHHESDCCGHDSATSSLESQSCCSDSYQVIVLTGCRADDDNHAQNLLSHAQFSYACADMSDSVLSLKYIDSSHYSPDSGDIVPCDRRVTFCVWRI